MTTLPCGCRLDCSYICQDHERECPELARVPGFEPGSHGFGDRHSSVEPHSHIGTGAWNRTTFNGFTVRRIAVMLRQQSGSGSG